MAMPSIIAKRAIFSNDILIIINASFKKVINNDVIFDLNAGNC